MEMSGRGTGSHVVYGSGTGSHASQLHNIERHLHSHNFSMPLLGQARARVESHAGAGGETSEQARQIL